MIACLSVRPARGWRPTQGVGLGLGTPPLTSCCSWAPADAHDPIVDKAGMENRWMDEKCAANGSDSPHSGQTHQNQQRCSNLFSPTEVASSEVKQSLQLKCPICQHRSTLHKSVCCHYVAACFDIKSTS